MPLTEPVPRYVGFLRARQGQNAANRGADMCSRAWAQLRGLCLWAWLCVAVPDMGQGSIPGLPEPPRGVLLPTRP